MGLRSRFYCACASFDAKVWNDAEKQLTWSTAGANTQARARCTDRVFYRVSIAEQARYFSSIRCTLFAGGSVVQGEAMELRKVLSAGDGPFAREAEWHADEKLLTPSTGHGSGMLRMAPRRLRAPKLLQVPGVP